MFGYLMKILGRKQQIKYSWLGRISECRRAVSPSPLFFLNHLLKSSGSASCFLTYENSGKTSGLTNKIRSAT